MASAPRDPLADHLLTAHNAALLPIDYSPRRWPRCAERPATPPRNARREASGRQHEASARDAANTDNEMVNVMPDALKHARVIWKAARFARLFLFGDGLLFPNYSR